MPFSVVRPTQFSRFQKESYEEGLKENVCLFRTGEASRQCRRKICKHQRRSRLNDDRRESMAHNNGVYCGVSVISLNCCICRSEGLRAAANKHLHLLSRCFHALRILCKGTEPSSSTLLPLFFFFFFTFFFFSSDQPQSTQPIAFNDKRRKERGWPKDLIKR